MGGGGGGALKGVVALKGVTALNSGKQAIA